MTTRIRESVPKKICITVAGSIVLAVGTLWASGNARAETGSDPQLDSLCFSVPAFAASAPAATLNGNVLRNNLVGLRAKNAYCTSDQYIPPPAYGCQHDALGDCVEP
jgi:hypothetical protein